LNTMVDYERVNKIIEEETKQCVADLKAEQRRLGMKHGPDPLTEIRTRISKNSGIAVRVRIGFKRSGVFVHIGVGRGTTRAQVGSTNRKAKEWFNPIVEKYADKIVERLADEWAEMIFDIVCDKLKMKY
jgi:hypothetical protein